MTSEGEMMTDEQEPSPIELLDVLLDEDFKTSDHTLNLIKDKFAAKGDEELDLNLTVALRVSLSCPLGKTRMLYPCRPMGCCHIQCFDALVYLKINQQKQIWKCPVCEKPAPYEDLILDKYFSDIISSPRVSLEEEIYIEKDGFWHQELIDQRGIILLEDTTETPKKRTSGAADADLKSKTDKRNRS